MAKREPKMSVLELHGTVMGGLPPTSIMGAAEEDMRRKDRNKDGNASELYAFHRRHVRRAKSPRMLLALALSQQELGAMSHKKSTRLLYKDTETLRKAWLMSVDKYGPATGAENKLTTQVDRLLEEAHKTITETEATGLTQRGASNDHRDRHRQPKGRRRHQRSAARP